MLPSSWKPKNPYGLVRVGPKDDGGYVIPEIILTKTKMLIGLGVNDDWRFEKEFKKLTNSEVVCYDHTVNAKFWRRRFKKDLFAFFLLKRLRPKKIAEIFKYFSYKRFFNGKNATHHRIMVGYDMPGQISIDGIIKSYARKENIFFKIDIEGSEYRVIDQLNTYADKILGFAIEFHDIDIHRNRINDFIEKSNDYSLVHIHANNVATKIDIHNDPLTVEMTFLRKDLIDNNDKQDIQYPIEGLDFPNSPKDKDIALHFEN